MDYVVVCANSWLKPVEARVVNLVGASLQRVVLMWVARVIQVGLPCPL